MTRRLGSTAWLLITLLACFPATPQALADQTQEPDKYRLPTKEIELAVRHRDTVLSAATVAVIVRVRPLVSREGKADAAVTYRAGRSGPDAARGEVVQALQRWGAFEVVEDPAQADLVLVVLEETLPPGFGSTSDIRGPQYRLKDTLGVYRGKIDDPADPLWAGIVTEGRLKRSLSNAAPSAAGVIEEFRRAVEDARRRVKE